jgi:hypothetical protein
VNRLTLLGRPDWDLGVILHYLETGAPQASFGAAIQAHQTMERESLGRSGTMWYFRLVGRGDSRSFHEQMAASGHFSNPLTVAVTPLRTRETTLLFRASTALLTEDGIRAFTGLVERIREDARQGRTFRLRVTGYASKWGWSSGSLAARRAARVRELRVAAHVPRGSIDVVNGGARTWFGNATVHPTAAPSSRRSEPAADTRYTRRVPTPPVLEDPLSTDAELASHPADACAGDRGRRRAPALGAR